MNTRIQRRYSFYSAIKFTNRIVSDVNLSSANVCLAFFCLGACGVLLLVKPWSLDTLIYGLLLCAVCAFRFTIFRPILFAGLGFFWLNSNVDSALNSSFPTEFERVDLVVYGDIIGLPKSVAGNVRFRFKISSVTESRLSSIVGQSVQLSCYRCSLSISSGQQWQLTVRLKRPHGYASWGAFDYEKYLFRHRLVAKGYVRLKSDNRLIGYEPSDSSMWRQFIRQRVERVVANSVGRNMILALVIGDKSGLTQSQQKTFQNTGVSHLMAISGLHVGLVFLSIAFLFKWFLWLFPRLFELCPRAHLVLLPAFSGACVYASLAGFAVSTQRALIMLSVYLVCKLLARQLSLLSVLILAATTLLLFDPLSLLDAGFWLSCIAVVIIALVSDSSEKTSLLKLQPYLWLGMMPISVILFSKVSLVSPLVNLIVVPLFCFLLIPLTLLLTVVSLVGLSDDALRLLATVFDWFFLALQHVESLPVSSWFTTPLMWWQWCLYLVLMLLMAFKVHKSTILFASLLFGSLILRPISLLGPDELRVVLLDVGQGLSMVIETANSVTVYDTGPRYSSGFSAADAVLLPYLRRRGIDKIDTLIISHADNDHIGGYHVLRDAFPVDRVLTSRTDKIPEAQRCKTGQSWQFDNTTFKILGPNSGTPIGSNNLSCVLKLEHLGTTVLITGDIEKQVERFMHATQYEQLSADIMLVPHQGSKTSSTAEFIDAVSPNVALLAAGYKNHYGHPHASVMARYHQRGIDVFSTVESGSVLLKINSRGWRLIEYRKSERRFWFD